MVSKRYFAILLLESFGIFAVRFYFPSLPLYVHILIFAALLGGWILIFLGSALRFLERKSKTVVFLLAAVFLLSALVYSECFYHAKIAKGALYTDGRMHTVTATVKEVQSQTMEMSSYTVKTETVDGEEKSLTVLLQAPYYVALARGDRVEIFTKVEKIAGDNSNFQRAKGIFYVADTKNIKVKAKNPVGDPPIVKVRENLYTRFDTYLDETAAGYADTLMTGNKTDLSPALKLTYKRLGISHLLAVSGLHLAVIVGGLDFLLTKMTVARKKKNGILLGCCFLFAALCTFTPSVTRAGLMLALYYLFDMFGEERDSITSLFLVICIMVCMNPYALFDMGLLLSFFATLGILTVAPEQPRGDREVVHVQKPLYRRLLANMGNLLKVTFAATAFTLPITFFAYGGFSLIAPISNLVFVPLTEITLYLLLLFSLLSFIPFMGTAIGFTVNHVIDFSSLLSYKLSDIPDIYISIDYPFAIFILLFFMLLLTVIFLMKTKRFPVLLASFVLCASTFGVCYAVYHNQAMQKSEIYMASDGASDVLTLVDRGKVMLLDITTGGRTVPTEAVKKLSSVYKQEIDIYLVSHMHPSHVSTLKKVATDMKIHTLLLPMPRTDAEKGFAENLEKSLRHISKIRYYMGDGTEKITVGQSEIRLPSQLHQDGTSHPYIAIYGKRGGKESFAYLGSGATDLDAVRINMKDYGTLIFGCHGPKPKKKITADLYQNADKIAVTDSGMLQYFPNSILDDGRLLTDKKQSISLTNQK